MKIKFENVGRHKRTWEAEYPRDVSLQAAAENEGWWLRQLHGAILSTPDWFYNKEEDCVDIFAGWRCVGKAYIVKQEEASND